MTAADDFPAHSASGPSTDPAAPGSTAKAGASLYPAELRAVCQGLLDVSPDPTLICDETGRILLHNAAAGRLLGADPSPETPRAGLQGRRLREEVGGEEVGAPVGEGILNGGAGGKNAPGEKAQGGNTRQEQTRRAKTQKEKTRGGEDAGGAAGSRIVTVEGQPCRVCTHRLRQSGCRNAAARHRSRPDRDLWVVRLMPALPDGDPGEDPDGDSDAEPVEPPEAPASPSLEAAGPAERPFFREVIEQMREPLASLRAAIETIVRVPDLDAPAAGQLQDIAAAQAVVLSDILEEAVAAYTHRFLHRRPLKPLDARTLLTDAVREMTAGMDVPVRVDRSPGGGPPAAALRIRGEASALRAALRFLAERVAHATRPNALVLRAGRQHAVVTLDLCWRGAATLTPDRLQAWTQEALPWGDRAAQVRLDHILERHDAEVWIDAGREGRSCLHVSLPAEKNFSDT